MMFELIGLKFSARKLSTKDLDMLKRRRLEGARNASWVALNHVTGSLAARDRVSRDLSQQ